MKAARKLLIPITICILTLTGCVADPYPEMTDAQYDTVVRYAAGLITRYSKGTTDRLTYLDTTYTPEHLLSESTVPFEAQQTAEASGGASSQASQAGSTAADSRPDRADSADSATTADTEPAPASDAASSAADDASTDAPETDATTDGSDSAQEGGGAEAENAEPVSYTAIGESALQTLGEQVRIEYTGYSVKNVYPDTQAQGAVAAAQGDKLLVVDFSVMNPTDAPVRFNTAEKNPQFKLVINSDVQGFTMVTMIANDLSGMDMEIAPGGRADAVLLMEVPEDLAKRVDTLDLIVLIRGAAEETVKLE